MAEISSPDYPNERLVVCRNPLLAEERRRRLDQLLPLTETDLGKIQARVGREKNPLRGAAEIGKAVGAVLSKRKMAKHFELTITDTVFSFTRKAEAIAEEARFDGFYALRTSLPVELADAAGTGRPQIPGPGGACVSLYQDGRSGTAAGVSLDRAAGVGPCPAVHAGVLPRMAHATAPGTHVIRRSKPPLCSRCRADIAGGKGQGLEGSLPQGLEQQRAEVEDGTTQPVHSFRTLLDDLATLTRNTVCFAGQKTLTVQTTPTPMAAPSTQPAEGRTDRRVDSTPLGFGVKINGLRGKDGKVRFRG